MSHLLLFLHITVMFGAVAIGFGPALLLRLAYQRGQLAAVRGIGIASAMVGPVIPIGFVVGGLLGLVTAISFGFNLLAPWLVLAYIGFLIEMVIGFTESRSRGAELGRLLASTPDGPITPELKAYFGDRRANVVLVIEYAVLIALIFDMVAKPLS